LDELVFGLVLTALDGSAPTKSTISRLPPRLTLVSTK